MSNKLKDLTGTKYGMLTVIGRGEDYIYPNGRRIPRWLCQCECGGTTLAQSGNLRHGKTKSCGCLQRKQASERMRKQNYNAIDISGQKFGRLTAIRPVERRSNYGVIWLCACDCGEKTTVPTKMLRSGNTRSCGCIKKEKISRVNYIHGKAHNSRLYNIWVGMRQRCLDPNHKSYKNYGGRGISICNEWNNFEAFEQWALKRGYDAQAAYGQCTIDRIDVDGNYDPDNCRWVDSKIQANNKRESRH